MKKTTQKIAHFLRFLALVFCLFLAVVLCFVLNKALDQRINEGQKDVINSAAEILQEENVGE